jgi:hypothetical protein
VKVDLDLIDPCHPPYYYQIDSSSDWNQKHYEQALRYRGGVEIDDEHMDIDTIGARDHSWGGLRNWTPGTAGHFWFNIHFGRDGAMSCASPMRSNGDVFGVWGYYTDYNNIDIIKDVQVHVDDGLEREDRAGMWARGDYPDKISYQLKLDGVTEQLTLSPIRDVAFGYEDRNWELTNQASPWLKSVYNRMPVECEFRSEMGKGWFEAIHPLL